MSNDEVKKWHVCERKKQYRTKKRALNDLDNFKKQGYLIPDNANAYECPYCIKWHLGHKKMES